MLRERLMTAMKEAMKAKDEGRTAAVRLIISAMKDRDIAARPKGQMNGIGDDEILSMMSGMIKQRRESIALYEQGNRPELAKKEADEIAVIESFMPKQLDEAAVKEAVQKAIATTGAKSLKDMGAVVGHLKQNYAGQMDFSKVAGLAKQLLGGA